MSAALTADSLSSAAVHRPAVGAPPPYSEQEHWKKGREGGREGGRKEGREGGRERAMEGGRERR